jgi:hypothetical protein
MSSTLTQVGRVPANIYVVVNANSKARLQQQQYNNSITGSTTVALLAVQQDSS